MKKLAAFIIIIFTIQTIQAKNIGLSYPKKGCSTDTLPTSELITYLQQLDISSFYGKPVDSFLLAVPANFYAMKVYGGDHSQGAMFRASRLRLDFVNNIDGPGVAIYVREYTHMNRYSPTATWDVNLFRQEKIYKIEVWKNQNVCINGSCLE